MGYFPLRGTKQFPLLQCSVKITYILFPNTVENYHVASPDFVKVQISEKLWGNYTPILYSFELLSIATTCTSLPVLREMHNLGIKSGMY